jgi:dTDP-D-glucose 4,6-dehydratase
LSLQNEMENIEIVGLILDVLELPFEENTTFVEDRLGHDFRYSIDNKKLLSLKNQEPTSFKQCLLETIRSAGFS